MGKSTFETRGLNGKENVVAKIKEIAGLLDDVLIELGAPEIIPPGYMGSSSGEVLVTDGNGGVIRQVPASHEAKRLSAMARTHLELSVMCAVKAVSRR
jgi:hypothetical protein